MAATGCNSRRKTDWSVSLCNNDKKPYGTWLSYHSLKYYFPRAKINTLSPGFRFSSIDDAMSYHDDSAALLVLAGLDFYVSDREKDKLLQFAAKGNEVLLFCSKLDNRLETALGCTKESGGMEDMPLAFYNPAKANRNYVTLTGNDATKYLLDGRTLRSYFSFDSAGVTDASDSLTDYIETNPVVVTDDEVTDIGNVTVLGRSSEGPDFIRYNIGDGHITLHAAPLVLSNYFLLQSGNRKYLDGIWHTLPGNISHIYWTDYFKRRAERSHASSLLNFPPLRWAFWIMITLLLVYVLFESKRRQRIIPIVVPPVNSSVTFAETVGRLYYNKGNHQNLAEKMIQHFLEWVRSYYYLNTSEINDTFVKQLTVKSGMPENTVRELVQVIHEVRTRAVTIDEPYLFHLYTIIQQFYKNR